MREHPFPSSQSIIDCLTTRYGIIIATLTRIPFGADKDALVYKIQASDQSSYFVKVRRGYVLDMSIRIPSLLHDAGIQEIICPIKTLDDQLTCAINDYTLIVYPFIAGKDGFHTDLTPDQWIALGRALRRVHEFQLPMQIKDQIKRESYSTQWHETVRSIYTHIDAGLSNADTIAKNVSTCMQKHRETILHIVDQAEQRAHTIQTQSPEFVLCHADIHAGNVLIATDGKLYIVDWDQPIMAPKERDLMFIGGGVGNVWNKHHQEELFYKGYENAEIDRNILAYYRYERIVQDVAEYCQLLLLTREGGADREILYQQFLAQFAPQGVIAIALKTDVKEP